MIDSVDIQAIKEQVAQIIADKSTQIVISRNGTALPAQTMRLVKPGSLSPREFISEAGKQVTADVLVLGDTTLDIEQGDRFSVGGTAYRVIFVEKSSPVKIVAEAQVLG